MKTTIKPLLIADKISDLYRSMGLSMHTPDPYSEFSIHHLGEQNKPSVYQSPVYRAGFFSFVFIKDACGHCITDGHTFELKPGTVYFNNPGHIKQFEIREARELYLITLSESFLKENVHAHIFDEFPFLLCDIVPPRLLQPQQFVDFEELYLQVHKAYNSSSAFRYKLIGHLIVAILIKIKENFWSNYNPIREDMSFCGHL